MKTGKWWALGSGMVIVVVLIISAITIFWIDSKSKLGSRRTEKEFLTSTARVAERPEVIIWSDPYQIKAPADKWSEAFSVPSGKFGIAVQKGERAEVLFSNGKYYLLDNYKQVEFGNVSGSFQFRGIGKDAVIYVYTAS